MKSDEPVHVLLVGPSGHAKSLFLEMRTGNIRRKKGGNGIYYSQGLGIISTSDGKEISIWKSQGIQIITSDKNLLRGSAFYTTTSIGKLAFLNDLMTVFRSETDKIGNISNKEWEWK
ncbi:MAG TPA: hypothetical protein VE971_03295 [Candidatus Eisenbacteria bacterium]|nr:hypothetical protein [Candidatus Eisenbacteria bacterium]